MLSPTDILETARAVLDADDRLDAAYLFGSAARNAMTPLSDIDLAVLARNGVLSPDHAGDLADRLALALRSERVDLIDLREAPIPLRYRVIRDGLLICCRDPVRRERFEAETVLRYLDLEPVRRQAFAITQRLIAGAATHGC